MNNGFPFFCCTTFLAGVDAAHIYPSQVHTCGVSSSGTLSCWGGNNHGQLGDNSMNMRTSPTLTSGSPTIVKGMSLGGTAEGFTCAWDQTGIAYCWGQGGVGQLGIGIPLQDKYTGQQLTTLSDVTDMAVGSTTRANLHRRHGQAGF